MKPIILHCALKILKRTSWKNRFQERVKTHLKAFISQKMNLVYNKSNLWHWDKDYVWRVGACWKGRSMLKTFPRKSCRD